MKELTFEDHDAIELLAGELYTRYKRNLSGVRGQMIYPEDTVDHWMRVATHRYVMDKLAVKSENKGK